METNGNKWKQWKQMDLTKTIYKPNIFLTNKTI